MSSGKFLSTWGVGSILIFSLVSTTISLENLSLTQIEKQKLEEFKEYVSKISLPTEWMSQELNLVRCLRARRWNLQRAKDMLLETVNWWRVNKIGEIRNEDWTGYDTQYPLHTDGVDKIGQPVVVLPFGEWDLRGAALQGKMNRVLRWFIKGIEDVHVKSIEYNKLGKTNGTQWVFVTSVDNFSRQQHLCVQCVSFYTELSLMFEAHFPGGADKIFMVNVPSLFQVVLASLRPILSATTNKATQALGTNKEEWGPILFSSVARDQLPESLGGTRVYSSE